MMLGGTQLFATRHTFTRPCKMVGYLRFENMYGRVNISAGREMLSTAPYERLGAPPRRQPRAGRVHADTLPSVQQRAATVFPRRRERGWDPERRTARAPAVDPEINPSTRFLPNALRSAATMVAPQPSRTARRRSRSRTIPEHAALLETAGAKFTSNQRAAHLHQWLSPRLPPRPVRKICMRAEAV